MEKGKKVGRPKGAESGEKLLAKPFSQAILEGLRGGLSLRKTAAAAGVAVNTVRKVKRAAERIAKDKTPDG